MAKRRTSGIQRRSRASDAAMSRRVGSRSGSSAMDPRILIVGGVLVVGAIILVVAVLFAGNTPQIGVRQVDQGGIHIPEGQTGGPYSSVPGTSGEHWNTATSPGPWGVYTTAQPQERLIHNLEHGGIVIWYQPSQLDADGVQALTAYVEQQVRTAKFKVILSPWDGQDFGHPIAVTAWDWLLYLDTADIQQVRAFLDAHYGKAPEPNGGPAAPG